MKICPFVSHLLGDNDSNPLMINGSKSSPKKEDSQAAIMLDYESSGGAVATAAKSRGRQNDIPSHLFCLKDACRFYHKKNGDCQFDLIFSMLNEQETAKHQIPDLSKDIDRVWQFQVQSMKEIVGSFADVEKMQTKAIGDLKSELDQSLDDLSSKLVKPVNGHLDNKLDDLGKKLDDRGESVDHLSATISELVMNFQESLEQLQKRTESLTRNVESLERSIPDQRSWRTMVETAVEGKLSMLPKPDSSIVKLGQQMEMWKDNLQSSLERRISAIQLPELSESLRKLDQKMDESLAGDRATSQIEVMMKKHFEAQAEWQEKLYAWHDALTGKIQNLRDQQQTLEDRFLKLIEQQEKLTMEIEAGSQERRSDHDRSDRKEAKKLNNLGVTSFHNGAYDMAQYQFSQAVRIDPEFAEAHNNLGLVYTELGEDDEASEAFQRAIGLDPNLYAAYNNLGYVFFKRGEYGQAIEMYNEALGRSSDNSSAYTNLGNAYYKLEKLEEARSAWTKAVELDPGNEKARRNLERVG